MFARIMILFVMLLSAYSYAENTQKEVVTGKPVNNVFIEGKHYKLLDKALPDMGGPVVEFMYYGCRTCFQLAPDLAHWSFVKKIDVILVPVHSETVMVEEARMFHTFELMNILGEMYEEGFVIFQTDQSKLQGKERVDSFLAKHKVNQEKFWQIWNSDQVNQRLAASALLTKQVQVTKTPTFVVHGVYKVDIESLKSVEELYVLLEYLLAKKPTAAPELLKKPV